MTPLTPGARRRLRKAKKAVEKVRRRQIKALGLYRDAIRISSEEGASVREIAVEVGMSHQRVHQILQAGCDACARSYREVRQLVQAGTKLTLCNDCIDRGNAALREEAQEGTPRFKLGGPAVKQRCDSCGKRPTDGVEMAASERITICSDCWELAAEIIKTHPFEPLDIDREDS